MEPSTLELGVLRCLTLFIVIQGFNEGKRPVGNGSQTVSRAGD